MLCAFNGGGRHIHIMGTKGELWGHMDKTSSISIYDFEFRTARDIPMVGMDGIKADTAAVMRGLSIPSMPT